MDDYVIGLLGCSVLDGTSLTKGTRRYGRYVMEGSQTPSPSFVCACATCVKTRGNTRERIIKKGHATKKH